MPGNGHGLAEPPVPFAGAAPAPSPVPTSIPLRVHAPLALPSGVEFRAGYGLGSAASSATGGELATRPRTTRLDRRVRIRSRWSSEDEFRRAGRAELFSDDARYQVVFGLTAGWYAPAALIYFIWALLFGGSGLAGAIAGLPWLIAAAAVSTGVSGLLRWASVGWRAITLSAAAAVIGGAITALAYTLTG